MHTDQQKIALIIGITAVAVLTVWAIRHRKKKTTTGGMRRPSRYSPAYFGLVVNSRENGVMPNPDNYPLVDPVDELASSDSNHFAPERSAMVDHNGLMDC